MYLCQQLCPHLRWHLCTKATSGKKYHKWQHRNRTLTLNCLHHRTVSHLNTEVPERVTFNCINFAVVANISLPSWRIHFITLCTYLLYETLSGQGLSRINSQISILILHTTVDHSNSTQTHNAISSQKYPLEWGNQL